MYIILGATGHVGSVVAETLLANSELVTIITHTPQKAAEWEQKGATVALADVNNPDELRPVFRQSKRLFLLNPPAAPSTDTAQEERRSLAAILSALAESNIEKVVAQSTYGAQPGEQVGDLGVLYELEQELAKTRRSISIIRGAYYMSNWDMALASAQQEGSVYTFFPTEFKLPMVAPQDLGQVAARLLREPVEKTGLQYVEGPELYSSADVAAAFSSALGKPVKAVETPREQWIPALTALGFSPRAAESMAAMTAITVEKKYDLPDSPLRGTTTLDQYINTLVRTNSKPDNL